MEGSYSKVWEAREDVPDPLYTVLVGELHCFHPGKPALKFSQVVDSFGKTAFAGFGHLHYIRFCTSHRCESRLDFPSLAHRPKAEEGRPDDSSARNPPRVVHVDEQPRHHTWGTGRWPSSAC